MSLDQEIEEKILRENLYDFDYTIPTNEMPREFYFKNRISKNERNKLINILNILHKVIGDKHSPYLINHRKAYHFKFGLLGIGTSVFPEKYWESLENFFTEKGYTREDFIEEEARAAMWNLQCRGHETYPDYLKWCDEMHSHDEAIRIISEEEFNQEKEKEEVPYKTTKKVGEILDRKGEDLDFLFCPEESSDFNYSSSQVKDFRLLFLELMKDNEYNIRSETDYLDEASYFVNPETKKILRYKDIILPEKEGSCRISFLDSRSFHFYFTVNDLNLKIRRERIDNWPFCQLLRRDNIKDLEATIKNGEETGIFKNPEYLKFKK